jgi:hypothetical protein
MPAPLRRLLTAAGVLVLLSAGLTGCAVADREPAITAPGDGNTISGKVLLVAEADGRRVEFFVNEVWVARDSTGPDFSVRWDTRAALDGEVKLVARVDGEELSAPVTVTVDNEPDEAGPPGEGPNWPPVPLDFPECEPATASNVAHPDGPAQYRPDSETFGRQTVMDARGSSWTRESAGDYPVLFKERAYPPGGTVCWLGGSITSKQDMAASWDDVWHHTYGFYTDHPYTTIVGLEANNQGDCIGIKEPGDTSLTRIHGVSLTDCHDDVIENDLMKNVEVSDSLLEGYVLFGGRGGSAGAEDGRNNTYRIDRVIGWVKPQEAVYKGKVPGTGPLFKRPNQDDEEGWEPRFTITDSVFRIDMEPNHGDLSIPPGAHSGNVIVWTGDGRYPGEVPRGFTVTTDIGVWADARAAWKASH